MTKIATRLSTKFYLLILTASLLIFSCKSSNERLEKEDEKTEENDMYDEAAAAQQFEIQRTKDPVLGYVPKERLIRAFEAAERSKSIAFSSRTTAATWVERGPTSDVVGVTNGNTRYGGTSSVAAGRIRAIWVDLNDATGNTVWIGGVDGGLWKTTNFKNSPANWTPINDYFTTLSISSICQDPVNKNIMYFSTGEAYGNYDAVRGNGVFKSTNSGATWTQLSSTSTYLNCTKILCDASGNIYLGTTGYGLLRSTAASGGAAWTTITPNGLSTNIGDFEISSTGRFHLSAGLGNTTTGGYRYTDNPATVVSGNGPNAWSTASSLFTFPSGANCRVELACSGNNLYAVAGDNSGNVSYVYKSIDGGVNWTSPNSTTPLPASSTTGFSYGQAWYCLAADINPSNSDNVVIGSLNCYATTNGGTTWTQISDWSNNYAGASTGRYVHADQQIIKWFANDELLVGSDGGITYSADAGASFQDRNTGLNIKQFTSCDIHPTLTDYFLAGAQDNGCHKFTSAGVNTTTEITGGDGAMVHIDQDESAFQFGSYVYNTYRRTTNSWASSGAFSRINFYKGTSTSASNFGSFINATDYDDVQNILYAGADAGELFRWTTAQTTAVGSSQVNYYYTDGFPSGASILSLTKLNSGVVSAVTVSPYTTNRLFVGTNNSNIVRIDNANTITNANSGTNISSASFPANSTISCIAVGSDDDHLMVTFSNYGVSSIWVTTNGTAATPTWTAIEGSSLPDMPIRWAVYDPLSDTRAWIATETGVWSTTAFTSSTTSWTASPGFPTVRTDMLKYRESDQTLIAATHGRGLWSLSPATLAVSTLPINPFTLRGQWKTDKTVELSWDYTNAATATFEIESSNDGTYFKKVGAMASNTNFTDQPSFTNIYYRVKGKNLFGNVSYSNVIYLQKGAIDIKEFALTKVYPNPVREDINIGFSVPGKGLVNYQITGINGQVVWRKDEDISVAGEYNRKWNIQNIKSGAYTFTIIQNNKKVSKKFSKL